MSQNSNLGAPFVAETINSFHNMLERKRLLLLSDGAHPSVCNNTSNYLNGEFESIMMPDANIYGAFIDRHKLYTLWVTATLCKDVPADNIADTDILVDIFRNGSFRVYHSPEQKLNAVANARIVRGFASFERFLEAIAYKD